VRIWRTHLFINVTSSLDPQWEAIGNVVIDGSGPVIDDINTHLPIPHFCRGLSSDTIDENGNRSSVRNRLVDVAGNTTDKLVIMTNTLATKVLLCKSGKDVAAYGVSIAPGAKLPIAQGFTGKQKLNVTNVVARREVIVSAGAFQSPQLASYSFHKSIHSLTNESKADGTLSFFPTPNYI
jgi:choline dehydrogenase